MGFGIFEGLWRAITGKVVWSRDVDLGSEGTISFRLKSKDDLLYAVMVCKVTGGALYYPMDPSDLKNLESALRATRKALNASTLHELALEKEAELMRLGTVARIWRWIIDTPLWSEDIVASGVKISFRVRRKVDKHAEIVFRGAEEIHHVKVQFRDLKAMEGALLATKAAMMGINSPPESEDQRETSG